MCFGHAEHETAYFTKFLADTLKTQLQTESHYTCTNNLTLKRVRATIVAVEKRKVLHILSVCL
jgi:hypothetical protein